MSLRVLKPLALSAVIAVASVAATATTADAGGRHHRHHHRHGGGNFAVGAIIGLTAGTILGGIAADNHARRSRSYDYYEPPRRYRRSVTVEEYAPEYYERGYNDPPYRQYRGNRYDRRASYSGRPRPWTDAWYRYCAKKYRSFDPDSGTFQPYEGPRRMCR